MKKILYLGNKLSHHGFTKGVIETLGPQLENEGFAVSYAGTRKNEIKRMLEMLEAILRNWKKADYVLIDTYSSKAFWYAWLAGMLCRLLKIEYIHILHGGSLPLRLKQSKKWCDALFLHSYANVAVSSYLKDAFDKAGYPAIVVPNNIDISLYPFKHRIIIRPRLLWVRSFHRIYNPRMAADVLASLLKDYPDAELCMIGPDKDGSMEDFKMYCEKLGISSRVKIMGLITKSEWHKLSEEYDIFINTTNIDNTPVSVIEAMALGLPVVSTNVGGIPFIIEDAITGVLVSPANADEMKNKAIQLMTQPVWAGQIISNARKKAEMFDWQEVKQDWIKLLNIK